MKFVTKSTNERDTQTVEDVDEYLEYRREVETLVPKLDRPKVIPQEMKVEGEVSTKGEKETDLGTRYPKRERRPPPHSTL